LLGDSDFFAQLLGHFPGALRGADLGYTPFATDPERGYSFFGFLLLVVRGLTYCFCMHLRARGGQKPEIGFPRSGRRETFLLITT